MYHANAALKNSLSDGLPTVFQLPWEFWSGQSWPQPLPLKVGTAAWAGLSPGTLLTLLHASPQPYGGSDFRLKAEAFIPTVMWRVWIPVGDKPRQVKSIQVHLQSLKSKGAVTSCLSAASFQLSSPVLEQDLESAVGNIADNLFPCLVLCKCSLPSSHPAYMFSLACAACPFIWASLSLLKSFIYLATLGLKAYRI